MEAIERIRDAMPTAAKDIALNLGSVLQGGPLDEKHRWGVAIACAIASGNPVLRRAVVEEASRHVGDDVLDDAKAAAALMAMNNVFYRFRHLVGKPSYGTKPARLRMSRLAQPKTDKVTFELISLAVSAINGCEACIRAHEAVVIDGGLTEEHVFDAVRIAATIRGAATALDLSDL